MRGVFHVMTAKNNTTRLEVLNKKKEKKNEGLPPEIIVNTALM